MTQEDLKELLEVQDCSDTIFLEDHDYASACIGLSHDQRLIYSYDKMVEHLMVTDDMTMEEAIEYIDYNIVNSVSSMGDKAPIICYDFIQL